MRAMSDSDSIGSAMARPLDSWCVWISRRLPREPEDALGDDVALDLAGTARDRPRERAHPLRGPRSLAPHRRAQDARVDRVRPLRLGAGREALLERLAAVQLEQRVLGRGATAHELRESPIPHQHQRLGVDVEAGDLVPEARVLPQRGPVGPHPVAEFDHRPHAPFHEVRVVDPEHRPFVRERSLRDRPTLVQLTEQRVAGHRDVGEEHFVEVVVIGLGELGERAALDAGRLHVDDQGADALVLRGRRIGAHEAQAPVRVMRARGPYLLPVHDEVVAVQRCSRRKRGEIAAGARLAHSQAPRDLRSERREEEPLLLVGGAVVLDRRRDDPDALRVEAPVDVTLRQLLEVDHLLGRARVATAELGRPAGDEPAVLEQRALPLTRPFGQVGARLLALVHDLRRRCVLVEPRDQVAPELLLCVAVAQSHIGDGTRYSPAPWTSSSARIRSCCAPPCSGSWPSKPPSRTCDRCSTTSAARPTPCGRAWLRSASSGCSPPRRTAAPAGAWSTSPSCSKSSGDPCIRVRSHRALSAPSASSSWPALRTTTPISCPRSPPARGSERSRCRLPAASALLPLVLPGRSPARRGTYLTPSRRTRSSSPRQRPTASSAPSPSRVTRPIARWSPSRPSTARAGSPPSRWTTRRRAASAPATQRARSARPRIAWGSRQSSTASAPPPGPSRWRSSTRRSGASSTAPSARSRPCSTCAPTCSGPSSSPAPAPTTRAGPRIMPSPPSATEPRRWRRPSPPTSCTASGRRSSRCTAASASPGSTTPTSSTSGSSP